MINGARVIVYSEKPGEDREFFRDVLRFPNIDAGGGWLIFGLPPSEAAFHPGKNGVHEFYLMGDDVRAFITAMRARGTDCSPIHEERWGSITTVIPPGGGKIGVYQPKHGRPPSGALPAPARKGKRKKAKQGR
jgi:hypothetical protein